MQLVLGVKCVDSLESVMQIADGEPVPTVSAGECVTLVVRTTGAAPRRHLVWNAQQDAHGRAPAAPGCQRRRVRADGKWLMSISVSNLNPAYNRRWWIKPSEVFQQESAEQGEALAGVTCPIMKMVCDRGEVDGCFVTGRLTVWWSSKTLQASVISSSAARIDSFNGFTGEICHFSSHLSQLLSPKSFNLREI